MTMPTFESGMPQSLYTLTSLRVARWNGTAYGTPVLLAEGQTMQFTPQADTDEKKAYGRMMRLLTVFTHVNFNMGVGLLQGDAIWVMTGLAQAVSGTSGAADATQRLGFDAGGAGLPYFGAVGTFASDDNGDVAMGIPLCKLDSIPSLSSEQNQFIMPESAGKGIANSASDTPRRGLFIDQRKVAADILDFDAFFGIS